jgi:predicted O-methyltransferase YrrM
MSESAITQVRRGVKRLVRKPRYRWMSRPAQLAWYYLRATGELAAAPAVLLGFRQAVRSLPTAQLIDFAFDAFGGMFRPFQNRAELAELVERIRALNPSVIVEIGTARGGSLFLMSCAAAANACLVSIDLPAGLFGGGYPAWKGLLYRRMVGRRQTLCLIRADSHRRETVEKARRALQGLPVDFLFIDGDHSYAGAKGDFLRYRELVRPGGLIGFHDILESRSDPDITVAPLWRELAARFGTEEIVESYAQGGFGIGLLKVPQTWEDRQPDDRSTAPDQMRASEPPGAAHD